MKKLLMCFLLPLLLSFSPPKNDEKPSIVLDNPDTTMQVDVSIKDIPPLVVEMPKLSTAINRMATVNQQSTDSIVQSISSTAAFVMNEIQKGRWYPPGSVEMDSITHVMLNAIDINTKEILHKKKVFDMTFYVIFLMMALWVLVTTVSIVSNYQSLTHFDLIKIGGQLLFLGVTWLIYTFLNDIVNYDYQLLQTVANLVPG